MYNFGTGLFDKKCPWRSYRSQIRAVSVGSGVTHIGSDAFMSLPQVTSIILPPYLNDGTTGGIGDEAFYGCTNLSYIDLGKFVPTKANTFYAVASNIGTVDIRLHIFTSSIGSGTFKIGTGSSSAPYPTVNCVIHSLNNFVQPYASTIEDGATNTTFTYLDSNCTVSLSAGTGGTVSGGGTYDYRSTATISAAPNTGYHFTQWSDGSTSASRSFTVTGNVSLTAYFAIYTYTVSLTAGSGGTVSGAGIYNYGASCTIAATPNFGYKFVQWSDGNTSASRSFTVTGDVTLSATFAVAVAKTNVKVNGSWAQGLVYVKVNGSWVESKKIYVKVNGTWEESN